MREKKIIESIPKTVKIRVRLPDRMEIEVNNENNLNFTQKHLN